MTETLRSSVSHCKSGHRRDASLHCWWLQDTKLRYEETRMRPESSKPCSRDSLWTRRRLLQVGGIGMLGLGLSDFLRASAPGVSVGRTSSSIKSCIFIMQYGGASHIDSWDLKPDAPAEIR